MSLEKNIRDMSDKEILEAPVPYGTLKDNDLVLIPRAGSRYGSSMTKGQYEAWRKKVLNTPLP